MSITVGTSTATSAAAGASPTLTINAGVVTDDVLLLGITNRDGTTDPLTVTDTDVTGNAWTKKVHQNATTNGSIEVWWKRATSATAGKIITIAGATGSCAAGVTPYTGCITTGDPLGTPVSEANASGNETQAGITTANAGAFVCLFVGCTSNDTLNPTTYTATSPTTLTERHNAVSTTGSDCLMAHASAEKASAGATGVIAWAQTDGTGASTAMELIPAPVVIAGDSAITETAETPAAAGGVDVAGASSTAESAETSAAAGATDAQGAAAIVESVETLSAAGVVQSSSVSGDAAIGEAAEAAGAAGGVDVQGAAAAVESAESASAAAVVDVFGAAAVAESAEASTAAGVVDALGAGAIGEAAESSAATGASAVQGTSAVTEAAEVVSSSGGEIAAASTVVTQGSATRHRRGRSGNRR